ncbi:MAG: hypothetical protein M3Z05_03905 [Gemmatimonadota bacterium]|nr:hypothetical protein [Gemmatimonadota bacterium]
MESTTSPFYQWLDHERIRAVLHEVGALRPGERLVLLKGLVPGLVEALGADEAESFLSELTTKARRYEEARTHPGEGRLHRETPGEQVGGPTPAGHRHMAETRNPDRHGGRAAEREWEAAVWARDVDATLAVRYGEEAEKIRATYLAEGMLPGEAELAAWEAVARLHGLTQVRRS